MTATKVAYYVNGKLSTVWSRIVKSKTTYVVTAFVLAKVEPLFENNGWQSWASWKTALALAVGGAGVILIRAAITKAELAANALNPEISGVEAVEVPASTGTRTAPIVGMLAALAAGLGLSACSTGSKLGEIITNPDGKPVVVGEICVNTPAGRFCRMPDEPTIVKPNPTPEVVVAPAPALTVVPAGFPPAPTPQPILPAAKSYSPPLEK